MKPCATEYHRLQGSTGLSCCPSASPSFEIKKKTGCKSDKFHNWQCSCDYLLQGNQIQNGPTPNSLHGKYLISYGDLTTDLKMEMHFVVSVGMWLWLNELSTWVNLTVFSHVYSRKGLKCSLHNFWPSVIFDFASWRCFFVFLNWTVSKLSAYICQSTYYVAITYLEALNFQKNKSCLFVV